MIRIAFDVGGVLSKYPAVLLPLIRAAANGRRRGGSRP